MNTTRVLGEGRLTWPAAERISNRYGAVCLIHEGLPAGAETTYVSIDPAIDGNPGTLVAEVLETRTSAHIGDLAGGLFPQTPHVGERIVLGRGTAFVAPTPFGADLVGLHPTDGREVDWLDPQALYRAHDQTVRVHLVPDRHLPADTGGPARPPR